MRRLTRAILLLYPRRVRHGHGPEIAALIDDLVAREGRSRARLSIRLAADGLAQRIASTATVWTAVAVLGATSIGGLAVSQFAAARSFRGEPRAVHTAQPSTTAPHSASVGRHRRATRHSGAIRTAPTARATLKAPR